MSNLYRGPSIDASYQVSNHLAKWFQRRRFLEIDQSETRIACGGHVCILVSDWLISKKKSSPLFKRKITLFKYRYLYSKCSYLYTDIADFFKSSLEPLGQMNRNLVGSIYEIDKLEKRIAYGSHIC
jgi:hypothetical protein